MFAFKLRSDSPGEVAIGIDPAETYYTDPAGTRHTFATIGKDYGMGVTNNVVVHVS